MKKKIRLSDKSQIKETLMLIEDSRDILTDLGIDYPNGEIDYSVEVKMTPQQALKIAVALYKSELLCINPRIF